MSVKFSIYSFENFSYLHDHSDAPFNERLRSIAYLFVESPSYEDWMSKFVKSVINGIGTKLLFEYFNRWFYQETELFTKKLLCMFCDHLLSFNEIKSGLESDKYALFEGCLTKKFAYEKLSSCLDSCGDLVKVECDAQLVQRLFTRFDQLKNGYSVVKPVKMGDQIFNIIMKDNFNGEITNGRNFRIHFKSAYSDSSYTWKQVYFCEAEYYSNHGDFINYFIKSTFIHPIS